MSEVSSVYWAVRGASMQDAVKGLERYSKEELIQLAINTRLNSFIKNYGSDADEGEKNLRCQGKRVPYIGWFWRAVDFANKRIPIGDCGEFVGFMENNKWGYPERELTEPEADAVISIVWQAMQESDKGGELKEIVRKTRGKLDELWELMQTFEVKE